MLTSTFVPCPRLPASIRAHLLIHQQLQLLTEVFLWNKNDGISYIWEWYWTLLGVLVTSFVRDTVETQWCPDNSDHTACYGPYDSDCTGKHSFAAASYRAEAILGSFGCSNFMVFLNQQNLNFYVKMILPSLSQQELTSTRKFNSGKAQTYVQYQKPTLNRSLALAFSLWLKSTLPHSPQVWINVCNYLVFTLTTSYVCKKLVRTVAKAVKVTDTKH